MTEAEIKVTINVVTQAIATTDPQDIESESEHDEFEPELDSAGSTSVETIAIYVCYQSTHYITHYYCDIILAVKIAFCYASCIH